ncbi:hypothetical protein MSAN_01502900 [Mycena sanguinolenta]|uniref:Uncharacterized protein n=1 Tax=Mycena sanguinolenta TaxID=230812 RepID=A0A8H7CWJ5_9AGAR|nr:hypothetical protein MSAN_01502900 [Mycena sanguinolenta]
MDLQADPDEEFIVLSTSDCTEFASYPGGKLLSNWSTTIITSLEAKEALGERARTTAVMEVPGMDLMYISGSPRNENHPNFRQFDWGI